MDTQRELTLCARVFGGVLAVLLTIPLRRVLITFGETGLKLWPGTAQFAGYVGNGIAYVGSE